MRMRRGNLLDGVRVALEAGGVGVPTAADAVPVADAVDAAGVVGTEVANSEMDEAYSDAEDAGADMDEAEEEPTAEEAGDAEETAMVVAAGAELDAGVDVLQLAVLEDSDSDAVVLVLAATEVARRSHGSRLMLSDDFILSVAGTEQVA